MCARAPRHALRRRRRDGLRLRQWRERATADDDARALPFASALLRALTVLGVRLGGHVVAPVALCGGRVAYTEQRVFATRQTAHSAGAHAKPGELPLARL